jgi:hypothetical protein
LHVTTRSVSEALAAAVDLNKKSAGSLWRLSNINELEFLVERGFWAGGRPTAGDWG